MQTPTLDRKDELHLALGRLICLRQPLDAQIHAVEAQLRALDGEIALENAVAARLKAAGEDKPKK